MRVYRGLVLVDLRAPSMAQMRMPRVRVRRTGAGAPGRLALLSPQNAPSRGHESRRSIDPRRLDRSRPKNGSGTWSRLTSLPAFGATSRLLLPVWVACAPRG